MRKNFTDFRASQFLSNDTEPLRKVNSSVMNKPASYTVGNKLQRTFVNIFADEFVDEFGKMSGRCLDIGSGPGDTLVDLILPKLNPGATIVCSDISENMLNYGKEKYKHNQKMSFVKLNIEAPNLPNDLIEQFDHAMSFFCLHWCQDMRQVFENIFNLLRPNGTVLLTFVAKCSVYDVWKVLAARPQYQPYMKDVDDYIPGFHYDERRRETMKSLLKAVGFEIHHCSVREKGHIHNTVNELRKFLLAINPFIRRMPADLEEEYTEDLVNEVMRRNYVFNKNVVDCKDDYSMLCVYYAFAIHLRKPASM